MNTIGMIIFWLSVCTSFGTIVVCVLRNILDYVVTTMCKGVPNATFLNLAYRFHVEDQPWYKRLGFHMYVILCRFDERHKIYKTIPFIL